MVKWVSRDAETEAVEDVCVARRCPQCQAVAPARAQWCSLCFSALDAPERATADPAEALPTLDAQPTDLAAPRAGRHARPDTHVIVETEEFVSDPTTSEQSGSGEPETEQPASGSSAGSPEAMLALLAAETPGPLSQLGGLGARLDSQGARAAVMLGGVVLCTSFCFVLLWLLGHVV